MANTYTSLYYHIVFSTKNRVAALKPGIDERIWAYIGGVARNNNMTALQVGGAEDHIHDLVKTPSTIAPCKIAQLLKGNSSLWIHTELSNLNNFAWQAGYGVFTVSKSKVAEIVRYIQNQRLHHRTMTFEDEYIAFLKKNEIDFDARYVLD